MSSGSDLPGGVVRAPFQAARPARRSSAATRVAALTVLNAPTCTQYVVVAITLDREGAGAGAGAGVGAGGGATGAGSTLGNRVAVNWGVGAGRIGSAVWSGTTGARPTGT